MVRRCSIGGCANKNSDGVNLYSFPSNAWQSLQWANAVKRTRADWNGPKPYSVICSDHFDDDSFDGGKQGSVIAATFGFRRRPRLKTNAVPTIFRAQLLPDDYDRTDTEPNENLEHSAAIQTRSLQATVPSETCETIESDCCWKDRIRQIAVARCFRCCVFWLVACFPRNYKSTLLHDIWYLNVTGKEKAGRARLIASTWPQVIHISTYQRSHVLFPLEFCWVFSEQYVSMIHRSWQEKKRKRG